MVRKKSRLQQKLDIKQSNVQGFRLRPEAGARAYRPVVSHPTCTYLDTNIWEFFYL